MSTKSKGTKRKPIPVENLLYARHITFLYIILYNSHNNPVKVSLLSFYRQMGIWKVTNVYTFKQLINSEEARHCRFQSSFHNTCFSEILRKTSKLRLGHSLGSAKHFTTPSSLPISSCFSSVPITSSFQHQLNPPSCSQLAEVDGLLKETFQE